MSDPEKREDLNDAFSAIMGAEWPEGGFLFDLVATKIDDQDVVFAAVLRRNRFLKDFTSLYPQELDVPGYSHRRVLKQDEGYADEDVPTEDVAILKAGSTINAFVDDLLAASDELRIGSSTMSDNEIASESTSTKLAFASEAWHDHENVAIWLSRIIDAAIQSGVHTATMTQGDIDAELFLCTGRTAADAAHYDHLMNHVATMFHALFGEQLSAIFPDVDDIDELAALVVEWGSIEATHLYETREDNILLTEDARAFLERRHTAQLIELEAWIDKLATSYSIALPELILRLRPFSKQALDVMVVGILKSDHSDEEEWTPEQQEIIDMWYDGTDENFDD